MMYKVIFLLSVIFFFSCNKGVKCAHFKEGHFLVKSDSISNNYHFNVYRNNNEQLEIDQNGNKTYMSIKWISDCSYEIKPIKNNKFKMLTDSSVVRVKLYSVSVDTALYQTYVFTNRGVLPATSGKMIWVGKLDNPQLAPASPSMRYR